MAWAKRRRLWIFDIDGTLTGPGGRGIQAAVVTGLFLGMRSGSLVGVNSERDLRHARSVHQLFDMNGPVIAESGCGWWQPSMGELAKGVCLHRITDEERQKIREAIIRAGLSDRVWEDWRKEYVSTWYPYAFNRGEVGDIKLVQEAIAKVVQSKKELEMERETEMVEVRPKGIDKGTGLVEVCGELEIPLEAVGYVGDSWNDWPALNQVLVAGGRGVMMGKDARLRQQVAQLGGEVLDEGSHGLVKWLAEEFNE